MAFVLKRTDGAYVAKRGSEHSYTRSILNARLFKTRKAAEADRCPDNERIVDIGYNAMLEGW